MIVIIALAGFVLVCLMCVAYMFWSRTGSSSACWNCGGRGGFWQDTEKCSVCQGTGTLPTPVVSHDAVTKPVPSITSYAEMKRDVDAASSAMWKSRAAAGSSVVEERKFHEHHVPGGLSR